MNRKDEEFFLILAPGEEGFSVTRKIDKLSDLLDEEFIIKTSEQMIEELQMLTLEAELEEGPVYLIGVSRY